MNVQRIPFAWLASKKRRGLAWRQHHRSFQDAVIRQWRTLAASRPAHVAVGLFTGLACGALTATVLGTLGALGVAVLSDDGDLFEIAAQLPLIVFVIVPLLAWSLAAVPAGVGGIVGAACAAVDSSWAGLEWAVVTGMGAALGLGVRYGHWVPALWGLAGGSLLGGVIGLRQWLSGRQRHLAPPTRRMWLVYGVTALLVAVFTWAMIDWVMIA